MKEQFSCTGQYRESLPEGLYKATVPALFYSSFLVPKEYCARSAVTRCLIALLKGEI